jgi:hypothetical protein
MHTLESESEADMFKLIVILASAVVAICTPALAAAPSIAVVEGGGFAVRGVKQGQPQSDSSRVTFYDISSGQAQFRADTLDVPHVAPGDKGRFYVGSLTHGYYSDSNDTTIRLVDPATKEVLKEYQHPRRLGGSLFPSHWPALKAQGDMIWMITGDPSTHRALVEAVDWKKQALAVKYAVPENHGGPIDIFPQDNGCVAFIQPKPYESTGLKYQMIFIPIDGQARDEALELPVPSGDSAFLSPTVVDNVLIAVRHDGALLTLHLPRVAPDAHPEKLSPVLSAQVFPKVWNPWQIIRLPARFGGDAAIALLENGIPGGFIQHIIVLKNGQRVQEYSMPPDVHVEELVTVGDRVFGYSPQSYSLVELSSEWKPIGNVPLLREVTTLTGGAQ